MKIPSGSIRVCVFLTLIGLASGPPAWGESTEELLQELRELQKEVEKRRTQLQQEIRLLKQVLEEEIPEGVEQLDLLADTMSQEELEAEIRILREELEILRQALQRQEKRPAFQIRTQVRTRFEWNDDDFTTGRADLLQLLRTRLGVEGAPRADTRVFVQVQDARRWGEETSTLADGDADNIDFHQAYLRLDRIFSRPLSVTLGRQEIICGSQRLVGAVDWHPIGRAFDAVKIRYGRDSFVDIFSAKLEEKGTKDRNIYGLYGQVKAPNQTWEPYLLFEHDKNYAAPRMKRATLGAHAYGRFTGAAGHSVGYEVEGAFQTGELAARDVSAWMATGSLTYTSPHWRRHQATAGVDWLSGDDDPADEDCRAFDTLWATNHAFYGLMDFFLDIPADTDQQGLVDLMVKGGMKAAAQVDVGLHLHHFSLAEGREKVLGQEVDLILTYQHNAACALHWGGLVFVPGEAMKSMKRGDDLAVKTYLQTAVVF